MRKFILMLTIILSLYGCNHVENQTITLDEIFLQPEKSYHVLFFLDSCMACRNIKLTIKNKNIKVYYIDLFNCSCLNSNKSDNEGINVPNDIKINSAPTLLLIEEKKVKKQINGYRNCRYYLLYY